MTECTPTPLPFATLNGRRVEADFSGGALTTDAGALLLREADRRLGLLDALDRCLPDPRDPGLITHPQRALLAQRVFGIACGYEDLNDHDALRHDPLGQALADYDPDPEQPLASAPDGGAGGRLQSRRPGAAHPLPGRAGALLGGGERAAVRRPAVAPEPADGRRLQPRRHAGRHGRRVGGVRLWDAVPFRPPGVTLAQERRVAAAAFSPDGKRLVTGGWDHTARLWDAATGRQVGEPMAHPDLVLAVAFSPDGKTVLTGCRDKVAHLWDVATGRPTGPAFRHKGSVGAVAFGPGGKVVTGSDDRTARLWDVTTGKAVGATMEHAEKVSAVAFSPDGKLVLTNGPFPGAHLWDGATGRPLDRAFAHPGLVLALAFSPDGRFVLTGGVDRTARLWDAATGRAVGEPLTHQQPVLAVAFSGDGQLMATGSRDGSARLWETATGWPFGPPLFHPLGYWVWAVALSPDGKTLATGSSKPYEAPGEGRLWPVPAPVSGSVERLATWAQVNTGMELDAAGVPHLLDATGWERARQRLEELGGPPNSP